MTNTDKRKIEVDVILNFRNNEISPIHKTVSLPISDYDNRNKFLLSIVKKFGLSTDEIIDLTFISCCIYDCPKDKRQSIDKWYGGINSGKFWDSEGHFDEIYRVNNISPNLIDGYRLRLDEEYERVKTIEQLHLQIEEKQNRLNELRVVV